MSRLAFLSLLAASLLVSVTAAATESAPRPLRQSELLALVAGNALPENVVNEIRARGVAFRTDDSFRTQLTTAGATPSILAALDAAKAPAKVTSEDKPDSSFGHEASRRSREGTQAGSGSRTGRGDFT